MSKKTIKEKPLDEHVQTEEQKEQEEQKASAAVEDLKTEVLKRMDGTRITSAALSGYTLKVTWEEVKNGITSNFQKKTDALVHMDLVNAFAKLVLHLAMICETIETVEFQVYIDGTDNGEFPDTWPEELLEFVKKIDVVALTFSGEYSDKITISGSKKLQKGRHALNTPSIDLSSSTDHPYRYKDELSLALDACVYEIKEFVFGSKTAFKQLDMFDEDEQSGQ